MNPDVLVIARDPFIDRSTAFDDFTAMFALTRARAASAVSATVPTMFITAASSG